MSAPRDLLLVGGRWFDPAGDLPHEAVLVRDGHIAALGDRSQLRARAGASLEEIDLRGGLVLAGLTDTHTHFFEWARRLAGIDLSGCADFDEVERRLRAAALRLPDAPRWIGGSGWDPFFHGEPARFTRHLLDEIFGDRPVALEARDFHTLWCNTAALAAAGVIGPRPVATPAGGTVVRDAHGEPTGLLLETAWDLVRRVRPAESAAVADDWLDAAERRAHALGLTAVHCMEPMATFAHYRRRVTQRRAGLRVCFHTPLDDLDARIERGERSYAGDDPWLRLGGVKVFVDGSLGSRTAAMDLPYPDGSTGRILLEEDELDEILARAGRAGIAGTVHAIGDRAVRTVAAAFARERTRSGPQLLHRMEHAQCVRPAEVRTLAEARVLCAMQPVHLEDDLAVIEREWGDAAAHAYPVQALVEAGVVVTLGSDTPVADPDPRRGVFATVARRRPRSPAEATFHPEHATSVDGALAGYTSEAARAWGEGPRGRVVETAPADLTVVDDVRDDPVDAWLTARVRLTIVDGVVRYEDLA